MSSLVVGVGIGSTSSSGSSQGGNVMGTYAFVNHASSPYTAKSTDDLIECDVSAGTVTIHLNASPIRLNKHTIKNSAGDASVNAITVDSADAKNVEDPNVPESLVASAQIKTQGASVTWQYDGTQWVIV